MFVKKTIAILPPRFHISSGPPFIEVMLAVMQVMLAAL